MRTGHSIHHKDKPANRWRWAALAVLVPAFALLWVGGVASHWLGDVERRGQGWLASLFLILAGLIVLVGVRSWRGAAALACVALLGFVVEAAGSYTGIPFGVYAYTDALQPQLFGVPLVMGFAWMSLIAYARELFARTRLPAWLEVAAAALWTTVIDLVIDPLAANQLGYWRWSGAGLYYGIPLTNFAGWFVVCLLACGLFRRRLEHNFMALVIGFAIVLFFALIALANHLFIAALIGFALCVAQFSITDLTRRRFRRSSLAQL